jgi:hypothetical protein
MGHVAAIDAIEVDGDNATIYAITSTVSGADPNKLVAITDSLDAGTQSALWGKLHNPADCR